jgi:hypothetical protein
MTIRSTLATGVVLFCLLGTASFSQENKTPELPLLTFGDLQKGDRDDTPFRIEGYVIQTYKCPPCPPGAMCKPCIGDHIVITDNVKEADPTLVKHLRIFTDKPEQFELKKKYSFVVKVKGKPRKDRAIEEVDLIRFNALEIVD